MFIRNWKKEICTIPNLLSLLRLGLLPVYARIYLNASALRHYWLAGGIMVLSCLTDLLDGIVARRLHQITNLGKVLDPLADKITQFTLTLCLSIKHPILQPVAALLLVKELFQLGISIVYLTQGKVLNGALMAGKICTAVLFISLIVLVLIPGTPQDVVRCIALIDGIFLVISFGCYLLAYLGPEPKLQNLENPE